MQIIGNAEGKSTKYVCRKTQKIDRDKDGMLEDARLRQKPAYEERKRKDEEERKEDERRRVEEENRKKAEEEENKKQARRCEWKNVLLLFFSHLVPQAQLCYPRSSSMRLSCPPPT